MRARAKGPLQPCRVLLLAIAFLLQAGTVGAEEPLLLVAPEFPPLTYLEDGEIRGIGAQRLHRIMKHAGLDYDIDHVQNYARAGRLVETGQKDGFFLATRNVKRDEFAVFLTPFYVNRWTWFTRADSDVDPGNPAQKERMRAASVVGTNTAKWLRENGYSFGKSPRNASLLLQMLDVGHIDAVLLSEPVFDAALKETGRTEKMYRRKLQVARPMGLYLSKRFAVAHPKTVERIEVSIRALLPRWKAMPR